MHVPINFIFIHILIHCSGHRVGPRSAARWRGSTQYSASRAGALAYLGHACCKYNMVLNKLNHKLLMINVFFNLILFLYMLVTTK